MNPMVLGSSLDGVATVIYQCIRGQDTFFYPMLSMIIDIRIFNLIVSCFPPLIQLRKIPVTGTYKESDALSSKVLVTSQERVAILNWNICYTKLA